MDGPIPSEMDIKVSIPAPTYCLESKNLYFRNGKRKNISLVRKRVIKKIQNAWLQIWNKIKIINNHHPRAHFIIFNSSSFVFLLWNRGETSSTTSLLLICTSGSWWFTDHAVFTSSVSSLCLNEDWFRNHSVFTTARHSKSSISEVTRLVATEHVRNKGSLREWIHLKSVVVPIASI